VPKVRPLLAAIAVCALGGSPSSAEADAPASTSAPTDTPPRDAIVWPGPPADSPPADAVRPPPEQARNAQAPKREPEDFAFAVPRALFTLPRVAIDSVAMPVSEVLHVLDDRAIARLRRVFLWNRSDTVGWMPVATFQSSYGLSFGARVFHADVLGNDETIELDARFGGLYSQGYQLRFHGERIGGRRLWIDVRGRYDVTPRLIFQGLGHPPEGSPESYDIGPRWRAIRTRYSMARGLASFGIGTWFHQRQRRIKPGIRVDYNHRTFDAQHPAQAFFHFARDHDDPSTEEVYDVARLPGYRSGVDVVRLAPSLELDFRDHRGVTSRGVTWYLVGGGAPPQMRGVAFAHYGTEITAFGDLFRGNRVLVARAGFEAVHGEDRRIPFSELPRLGGPMRLRGYRLNRFRDKLAVFGTVEYRYPIHEVVAGFLFVDGGRVARNYRELVSGTPQPWRVGYGGGFQFHALEKVYVRIDLSYGEDFLVFFSTDPLRAFADRHVLEL
jgi:hypothetical protein